jgi:hypothetical protein
MVRKCVCQNCSNSYKDGHSVYEFPKDPAIRRQWVKFVQTKRANFDTPSEKSKAVVCDAHFLPECFESPLMLELGFKKRKKLVTGSVPTIHAVQPTVLPSQKRQTSPEPSTPKPKRSRAAAKLQVARVSTSEYLSRYCISPYNEQVYNSCSY